MSARQLVDLSQRRQRPEKMDDPGLDPSAHRRALRGLQRVNFFSGTAGRLWRAIRQEFRPPFDNPLRICDLGCGGGDVLIAVHRHATRAGWPVELLGCDLSETALERARRRANEMRVPVDFERRDLFSDGLPDSVDVFVSSLFLHHLSQKQALQLLEAVHRSSAQMLLISDLLRSRWGYRLASWGCRLISRSPVVHFDGPVSVEAAFTIPEVEELCRQAGMPSVRLTRHWPERYLLTWTRQPTLAGVAE